MLDELFQWNASNGEDLKGFWCPFSQILRNSGILFDYQFIAHSVSILMNNGERKIRKMVAHTYIPIYGSEI